MQARRRVLRLSDRSKPKPAKARGSKLPPPDELPPEEDEEELPLLDPPPEEPELLDALELLPEDELLEPVPPLEEELPPLPEEEDELLPGASNTRAETVCCTPQALGRTTDTAGGGSDRSSRVEPAQEAPDSQDVYWLVWSKRMFEAS